MKAYLWLLFLVLVIVGLPSVSTAGACTPGINCYCDRVKNPSDPIYDPQVLVCEDFEPNTYHDNVNFSGGAPNFGPWHDDSGQSGNRGVNSLWNRRYGNGSSGTFNGGEPSAPVTIGPQCGFGVCSGMREWRSDNLWQANDGGQYPAHIDMIRNGEFDDDPTANPALIGSGPTNTSTGGSGVFDGQTVLGHRVPRGNPCNAVTCEGSIIGIALFPRTVTTVGLTTAVAYAPNLVASLILNQPWKHNEWGSGNNGIFMFYNEGGLSDNFPFTHFLYAAGNCDAALATATIRKGSLRCVQNAYLNYLPNPSAFGGTWVGPGSSYRQSVAWPLGKWGCVQGYFRNMNTTNATLTIWFNGVAIIDFDIDGTQFQTSGGINQHNWDNYANQNSNSPGTIQTTYRYEDNWHVREGSPVSCAQIGFGGTSDTSPPAAPTNLRVQ